IQHDDLGALGGGVGADALSDRVGVGEEQAALDPQDDDAGQLLVVGVAFQVAVLAGGAGDLAEHSDVGVGGAVDQQQQRDGDTEKQPGQGTEDQHPDQGGDRGDEVGTGGHTVVATEPAGGDPGRGGRGRDA